VTHLDEFCHHNVFFLAWLMKKEVKNVLVLGLGGGIFTRNALAIFPEKEYPGLHVTAVDIDPQMFDISRRYFEYPSADRRLENHAVDARVFLRKSPQKYDLIAVDVFSYAGQIPSQFMTREFFSEVKNHLTIGGVVAMNTIGAMGRNPAYEKSLFKPIAFTLHDLYLSSFKTLRSVFGEKQIVTFSPNRIGNSRWNEEGRIVADNIVFVAMNGTLAPPIPEKANSPHLWNAQFTPYGFKVGDFMQTINSPGAGPLLQDDLAKEPVLTDNYNPAVMAGVWMM
jgi:hypothetical protein